MRSAEFHPLLRTGALMAGGMLVLAGCAGLEARQTQTEPSAGELTRATLAAEPDPAPAPEPSPARGALVGPDDPEIREKLKEMEFLEKSIGKTGRLALAPILHTGIQEHWQLGMIRKK